MRLTRLDRIFVAAAILFGLLASLLLWRGDQVFPEVESFNLADQTVGPQDAQFLFIFNREMDRASVQAGLSIQPALAGKFSWIGRRLAYTPTELPAVGERYTVTLTGAKDADGRPMASAFVAHFNTPRLRLAYMGVDGDEEGRLVVLDLASGKREAVTPAVLRVSTYRPDPDGRHLLFMATERAKTPPGRDPTATQELYSVDEQTHTVTVLADSKNFINYDFNVSPDGKELVLTRDQFDAGPFIRKGLWVRAIDGDAWAPFPRQNLSGYPAWFSPDGESLLAIDAGRGFVLAPVGAANPNVQFLGNFVETYGFSRDGNRIAFLAAYDEGPEGRREEYLTVLDRGGNLTPIARGRGVTADPHFSPDGRYLYFLMSSTRAARARPSDFHLFRYDFTTRKVEGLTHDRRYQEDAVAVSLDGRQVALERYSVRELTADQHDNFSDLFGPARGVRPELWICAADATDCRNLGLRGRRPRWLN